MATTTTTTTTTTAAAAASTSSSLATQSQPASQPQTETTSKEDNRTSKTKSSDTEPQTTTRTVSPADSAIKTDVKSTDLSPRPQTASSHNVKVEVNTVTNNQEDVAVSADNAEETAAVTAEDTVTTKSTTPNNSTERTTLPEPDNAKSSPTAPATADPTDASLSMSDNKPKVTEDDDRMQDSAHESPTSKQRTDNNDAENSSRPDPFDTGTIQSSLPPPTTSNNSSELNSDHSGSNVVPPAVAVESYVDSGATVPPAPMHAATTTDEQIRSTNQLDGSGPTKSMVDRYRELIQKSRTLARSSTANDVGTKNRSSKRPGRRRTAYGDTTHMSRIDRLVRGVPVFLGNDKPEKEPHESDNKNRRGGRNHRVPNQSKVQSQLLRRKAAAAATKSRPKRPLPHKSKTEPARNAKLTVPMSPKWTKRRSRSKP